MSDQHPPFGGSIPTLDHVQIAAPPGAETAARRFRFYTADPFGNRLEILAAEG